MKVARDVKGDNVSKSGTETSGNEGGVMFPRLNVKETKKDGRRAPPRNKMALYEQFTIPSNRFFQPTHAAPRQNPTPLINQPVSCDGRFVYAPYYVSPHVYPTVNFPGQFLGQNVMSCTNSTATESDKSTKKCDVAKNTEQPSRVPTHSSVRDQKIQCFQNPFSSHMNHVEDLTLQASRKLSNSDVADGATLGDSHLQKKEQKTNNPIIGCISEDLRTVPVQVDNRLNYPVHQSLCPVIQNDRSEPREKEPELYKDGSQYPCGDVYCAKEELRLEKRPNKGTMSRVEYEDSYQCKNGSKLDHIANSKGTNLCSSNRECQAYVEQIHGAKKPLKTTSACAESQYSVENLSRDLDKDIDGCQKDEQSNEKENLRDQGDLSEHNSDSSMVDSLHAFEITPKSVISAIGQKEFWRVRKAIIRQQKIFSTQVFELHRLVKVQKLIAMPSNLLIDDNMYKSLPVVISEEQCVPIIDPEKCPKPFSAIGHNDHEIATDKGKPCNNEIPTTHSSISSHPSARGGVELIAHDTRDRSHTATFPVGTFAAGSGSAWGYPAYLQNPCAVPAGPGFYGCYPQYPLSQMGVPNAVMGLPCSLEGNSIGSRNVHGCQHQCQCSAEHQANVLGHFPKYPSRDGLNYNSPALVPFEPFRSVGKACYPFSDAGISVGNGSGEDMSAGSFRSESVLKQSKQVTNLSVDKSSNAYRSQDSVSQVSVGQDNQGLVRTGHVGLNSKKKNAACHPSISQVSVGQDNQGLTPTGHLGLHSKNSNAAWHPSVSQVSAGQDNQGFTQMGHLGQHSKNRNAACQPSASLSEQRMNDTDMQEVRFNSLNWAHSEDVHEYESSNAKESNEDVADVPDVVDLENQALSLFPLSSSFSWSSKTVKGKAPFSLKEPRVRVIKAVPRTAMAASESTADILLSLQRERHQ